MSLMDLDHAVVQAFRGLGRDWALLAAGDEAKFNAMTISWGALGFIWERPVVSVMVRPSRYTHDFIEKQGAFSLGFFGAEHSKALGIMGTRSGRDGDKVALSGLSPVFVSKVPAFKEAYLTVIARIVCQSQIEAGSFRDDTVRADFYGDGDYHTLYQAELVKVVRA